jgi:hypothetical protein
MAKTLPCPAPGPSSDWPGRGTKKAQPALRDLRYTLHAYSDAQCQRHIFEELHLGGTEKGRPTMLQTILIGIPHGRAARGFHATLRSVRSLKLYRHLEDFDAPFIDD